MGRTDDLTIARINLRTGEVTISKSALADLIGRIVAAIQGISLAELDSLAEGSEGTADKPEMPEEL